MPYYSTSLKSTTYLKHSGQQINQWLKRCNEGHENSRAVRDESTFLPSRLIEITTSQTGSLGGRLRLASDLGQSVKYATLSHCWGSNMSVAQVNWCRIIEAYTACAL